MTEKKPQAARVVEIPTVQNVPSDDIDTENDTPFKPTKELSTPTSSFLIKDIFGNEIKITQIQTQDTVGTGNVNYSIDRGNSSDFQFNQQNDSTEQDVSDLNSNLSVKQDVSETNINETDLSECEVTENISEYLPVPENVNPLPQGRWLKAEEIFKFIQQKNMLMTMCNQKTSQILM